ncbi:c-type cytochrome [Basilea psittacipulmonis]|uniref:Cytochrome C n=1 Tax=Basilea psittacipulmonis DSM 24701 TaxID=1072685 RepID=A0A077DCQ5_9BURK|nr:cytochrome c [Basilea psittacipulmonis]AIL32670.1 hypothetical protein IX83_04535 [Basilea psittacipulmonis DSM 24701]
MKKILLAFLLVCITVGVVQAAPTTQERTIKYRQSAFTVLANQFGKLASVVKGGTPYQADQVKAQVALIATLADLPFEGFDVGTEGGDAKTEIWSQASAFNQKTDDFKVAVKALQEAADTSDLNQVKIAFGKVGASCKSCHNDFRN